MEFFKDTHYKFLKIKYWAFALSFLIIAGGVVSLIVKGGFRMGVDFQGGTLVQLSFSQETPINQLRDKLGNLDLGSSTIQKMGGKGHEYVIRTQATGSSKQAVESMDNPGEVAQKIVEVLRDDEERRQIAAGKTDLNLAEPSVVKNLLLSLNGGDEAKAATAAEKILEIKKANSGLLKTIDQVPVSLAGVSMSKLREKAFIGRTTIQMTEVVGSKVGKDLRRRATLATIWALAGMMIYIACRFQIVYGIAAVLPLAHDVLVTLAFISFFNYEISLTVIAALLTIVGYSVNDTIVIFDRIRDNIKKYGTKMDFEDMLNLSINETLSRTIITALTVFMTVLCLYLFGGEVIKDFSFTMLVGVISGSYSTIYQSCAWVGIWEKHKQKRKEKAKLEAAQKMASEKTLPKKAEEVAVPVAPKAEAKPKAKPKTGKKK